MKSKILIIIALLCLIGFCSCDNGPGGNPTEPNNPFAGTKWKLVGTFDSETNEFITEADRKDLLWGYTLKFYVDSVVGCSSGNRLTGLYKCNFSSKSFEFVNFGSGTTAGETNFGFFYVKTIKEIQSFYLKNEKLRLYYNDKKNYFLYEQLSQLILPGESE